MGIMHAAKLETSERLRKVLDFLRQRGKEGATTREISKSCDVYAINSIITELRRNGQNIKTDGPAKLGGAMVYRYTLLGPDGQAQLF